jgi:transposase-like protein
MRQVHGQEAGLAERRVNDKRDMADLLRGRARLLCGSDRALAQMYFDQGSSFRQIARLAGVTPATVGRRIRRIVRRLADETYPLCLAGHDDFTGRELVLIKDYFVRGLTMTRISREQGVPYHRVRGTIRKARKYAGRLRTRQPQTHHATTLTASARNPATEGIYDDNL